MVKSSTLSVTEFAFPSPNVLEFISAPPSIFTDVACMLIFPASPVPIAFVAIPVKSPRLLPFKFTVRALIFTAPPSPVSLLCDDNKLPFCTVSVSASWIDTVPPLPAPFESAVICVLSVRFIVVAYISTLPASPAPLVFTDTLA